MLDFFGAAVKAEELLNHCGALKLLAKRVDALAAAGQDPVRSFRLDAGSIPPAVKWGKQLNWSTKDDAMLLLGVHYHGLGHWEAIIKDERLGLGSLLAGVLAKPEPREGSGAAGGGEGGADKDKEKDAGPKGVWECGRGGGKVCAVLQGLLQGGSQSAAMHVLS
jgi:chromodomain-helicase-DNA-binding protein 1